MPYGNSMATATGYSFPSGHTMNAASVCGGITVRKDMPRALRFTAGFVVTLVMFSRVFLGVHTPQDVLVGAGVGMTLMWLVYRMMRWLDGHPEKDRLVAWVGVVLAAALAVYAAVKPYPADYDAQGRLLVDGVKMANDTFKGVGWCAAFLVGWILERRCVGFSTEVSAERKLTRTVIGALAYYAISLILVPWIKAWIRGPSGTMTSCFSQMFYVSFLFPWCMKRLERGVGSRGRGQGRAGALPGDPRM